MPEPSGKLTVNELILREERMLWILNDWLATEEKPIRKETFRVWREMVRRRLKRYKQEKANA